ncbi:MAG: tRNA pseudouridine(55) synthase TruB [Alphaproteobacteria bacterium]|nr:tRNA pseudouridine(55) synthase TruB [Alphaproteobacteria bacterium]
MGRRKKGQKIHGWVNLDKPEGLTSTQALGKVRRFLDAQKAGHAGTLDPAATGILPIALGEATKTIPFVQDRLKTYEFEITWGEQRDTDDREGDVIGTSDIRPEKTDIEALLSDFTGEIEQTPPRYSAIKIDGERAYDLARDGEEFEIKSRIVYIESLELIEAAKDMAKLRMTCGKGTYVRSLARDMAEKLGTLGYISMLRRAAVGGFNTENAISLEKLEELVNSAASDVVSEGVLLPLEAPLDDIPALNLKQDEGAKLRNGQVVSFVAKPDFDRIKSIGLENDQTAIAMLDNKAFALVERNGPNIKPVRVFNL